MTDRRDEPGSIVRPYTLTGGRTRPTGDHIDVITIVTAVPAGADQPEADRMAGLTPEHLRLLAACGSAASVAEIAAETGLGVGVTRMLVGDLRDRELVTLRAPATVSRLPQENMLRNIINGLKAL
jgi:hypothetical protein